MGYYANGYRTIVLKDGIKELPKDVWDKLGNAFEIDSSEATDSCTVITMTQYEKYYEETVYDALNACIPYIKEGEIEYTGEDDAHWCQIFNPAAKKWDEKNGDVVYSAQEALDRLGPDGVSVVVYKEYSDDSAYGEELIEVYREADLDKARGKLVKSVTEFFGCDWEEVEEKADFCDDDTFSHDYVSYYDGDAVHYWVIEKHMLESADSQECDT